MLLACDIAMRSIGWITLDRNENIICNGVIKSTNKFVITTTLNPLDNNYITNKIEIPKTKYKNEFYFKLVKQVCVEFVDILKCFNPDTVVCELPHSGGMDFRSTSQMSMSIAMIACIQALENYNIEIVQPTETRKILQKYFNLKKVTKDHSIQYVTKHYEINLPKTKELQHHVTDAVLAFEVWKYLSGFN